MFVKLSCGVTLKQRVNFAQLLIYIESCLVFFFVVSCCGFFLVVWLNYFFFLLHLLQRLFCTKVTAEILRNHFLWKVVSAAAICGIYCILTAEILQNKAPYKNFVARYSVCLRYTWRDIILLGRKQPHSAKAAFFIHQFGSYLIPPFFSSSLPPHFFPLCIALQIQIKVVFCKSILSFFLETTCCQNRTTEVAQPKRVQWDIQGSPPALS